uniref:Putative conserved secreted protein n=1 Tax=Lutzomyia longipalpis TaxID=7200 RepID=A0A1B0EZP8_LUTLO
MINPRVVFLFSLTLSIARGAAGPPPKCYLRLEEALDEMLFKSQARSQPRTFIDLSTYTITQPLNYQYPVQFDSRERLQPDGRVSNALNSLQPTSVDVSNVKFRIPKNVKWRLAYHNVEWDVLLFVVTIHYSFCKFKWDLQVRVERCQLNMQNRTLDTRLAFPDLTIYGRVTLRPVGGHCDMILRLRRVGIDFQTSVLPNPGFEKSESRSVNVRTDSYFAEPGFMSIFAHGCEGPNDVKFRRVNSKMPLFRPDGNRRRGHELSIEHRVDNDLDGKTFSFYDDHRRRRYKQQQAMWQHIQQTETSEEIANAFLREVEHLFSKGVQGILTSYIQRMLQPAIKNTLMEGMGYTLSYG